MSVIPAASRSEPDPIIVKSDNEKIIVKVLNNNNNKYSVYTISAEDANSPVNLKEISAIFKKNLENKDTANELLTHIQRAASSESHTFKKDRVFCVVSADSKTIQFTQTNKKHLFAKTKTEAIQYTQNGWKKVDAAAQESLKPLNINTKKPEEIPAAPAGPTPFRLPPLPPKPSSHTPAVPSKPIITSSTGSTSSTAARPPAPRPTSPMTTRTTATGPTTLPTSASDNSTLLNEIFKAKEDVELALADAKRGYMLVGGEENAKNSEIAAKLTKLDQLLLTSPSLQIPVNQKLTAKELIRFNELKHLQETLKFAAAKPTSLSSSRLSPPVVPKPPLVSPPLRPTSNAGSTPPTAAPTAPTGPRPPSKSPPPRPTSGVRPTSATELTLPPSVNLNPLPTYSFSLLANFDQDALEPLNITLNQHGATDKEIEEASQIRRMNILKEKNTVTDEDIIKSALLEATNYLQKNISIKGPNYLNIHGAYAKIKANMQEGKPEDKTWLFQINNFTSTKNELSQLLIKTQLIISELDKYKTNDKKLLGEILELKNWQKNLINVINSKNKDAFMRFCLDTNVKLKTPADIQGSLVSSYTEDLSERNAFRKRREDMPKMRISHENLKKWDTINSNQYDKMIELFTELNTSSNELADVLIKYEKKEITDPKEMRTACDNFNLKIKEIKIKNKNIKFTRNEKNVLKKIGSMGELSQKTLHETLDKITKEVNAYKNGKIIKD